MRRLARILPHTTGGWTLAAWITGTVLIWLWIRMGLGPSQPRPELFTWRPQLFSLWYSFGSFLPGIVVVGALARRFGLASSLGRGMVLVLSGVAIWSLGNLMWFWYETCPYWMVLRCDESNAAPYPSPADIAYLLMVPLMLAGASFIGHALGVRRFSARMLALLVVMLVASIIVGMQPVSVAGFDIGIGWWTEPNAAFVTDAIAYGYVVGDVLLLWGAFVLVIQATHVERGVLRQPLLLLSAGMACFYVADVAFLRDMLTDNFSEIGFSNSMYAVAIAVVVIAVHRATCVGHVSEDMDLERRDVLHEAADAIVTSQARLLGTLAWRIAGSVPGIRVRDDSVTLALPYQDSLRGLVRAYESRTGHFGRQLAGDALAGVAADHPDGAQLESIRMLLAERSPSHRELRAGAACVITWGIVCAALAVLAFHVVTGADDLLHDLLLTVLPTLVIVVSLATGSARVRAKLNRRSHQLERANETLATLLEAVEGTRHDERARVAGEIHDFALQQLLAARMHLERIQVAESTTPGRIDSRVAAEQLIADSIQQLRRIMEGLEPSALFHRELPAALEELGRNVEAAYQVRVSIDADNLPPLQLQQQLLMFRVISETVTNAGKHAQATQVEVRTDVVGSFLHASIVDDGRGLGDRTLVENRVPASIARGWGLRLVVEQLVQDGGSFRMESAPGAGTRIDVRIPFRDEERHLADEFREAPPQLTSGAAAS